VSDGAVLAILAVAITTGALVQGTLGLGLGLVAAPVVTLVDASLMPELMLWLAVVLPLLTLVREWRHADLQGLKWSLAGRVPGTVGGVAIVALASDAVLGVTVGVMVLVAVVLSVSDVRVALTPRSLLTAGAVSGVAGTATSVGGPPLALLYQHHPGPVVRATLAVYFCFGATLSLAGLAVAGEVRSRELLVALVLAPCLAVGFALSGPVRRHVDAGRTRRAILALCAASAVVLIVRSVLAG
jgi:uncharacterized membrane protein YfcA